jgi:hypothetical protein
VSAFAAGCAVCGADLEAARARQAQKRHLELPGLPSFGRTAGIDWVELVIVLLLAATLSPLGLLISVYLAVRHHRYGESTMMVLMLVTAAIALAGILEPYWFGSHLGI